MKQRLLSIDVSFVTHIQGLFSKAELAEPAFQDVIVLYRTVMPAMSEQQLQELTPLEQDLRKRNICIKRLFNIPMADMEIIFPDRKLHLQPITIVQLVVNLIAGIVAAYMMVVKVRLLIYGFKPYSHKYRRKSR